MASCARCEKILGAADREDVYPLCQSSPAEYCSLCQELAGMNDEIERVTSILHDLFDKRDKLRGQLNNTHPSIIDRLPVEVAAKIFVSYVSDIESWKVSPLKLGAISRRWRQIAWSTPALWSDIAFYFHSNHVTQSHLEIVEEWLARVANHPLTIRLLGYNVRESDPHLHQFYPLIDLLKRHCNQWYDLYVALPTSLIVRLGGPTCVARNLHLLSIGPNDNTELILPTFSHIAPENFKSFGPLSDTIDLDWSRATDINITSIYVDQILLILRQSPNLLKCCFDDIDARNVSAPTTAYQHVTHSSLKSLRIRMASEAGMGLFLNNVTFPTLRDLRIRDWASHPGPANMLRSLIIRSGSALKTMRLETLNVTAEELIALTEVTRSLETLRIYPRRDAGDGQLEAFYRALQAHLPSNSSSGPVREVPLLPLLRSFEWKGHAAFPWDSILAFLVPLSADGEVSRRPLERIEIVCRGFFIDSPEVRLSDNIISELSPFQDEVEFHFKVREDLGDELDLWFMTRDYYRGNLGEGGSDTY
ncbi:hypothetical protein CVT26_014544 [Gymnopilus dilepis]|uniref:Uncharacterized protein n=1 Tax=Gymnopilus dilepis TaxID=231916 RepID=A0A409W377_9AGAR|nr:hypothetical protein CVT26_014544 [Gymnopilus dilepis]